MYKRQEPLRFEACEDSLRQAQKMFPDCHYFVCDSWLLYPGLKELMKPDSNIIRFQERFHIFEVNEAERDAELRIFRTVREAVSYTHLLNHLRLGLLRDKCAQRQEGSTAG